MRTDRFLDPPEFQALHDAGHQVSFFDRLDAHTGDSGTFHLNVQAARSSFDVQNSLEAPALGQAQHQAINTFNIAPGISQVLGSKMLFTANGYERQDHLTYTPSPDSFADQPGTVTQDRKLTNFGFKADVTYSTSNHNLKVGGTISATKLDENFTIGFTDPAFNSPCLDASGNPSDNTELRTTTPRVRGLNSPCSRGERGRDSCDCELRHGWRATGRPSFRRPDSPDSTACSARRRRASSPDSDRGGRE